MKFEFTHLQNKCHETLEIVGEHLEIAFFKTRAKAKRAYKFMYGRSRKKGFLVQRLNDFDAQHKILFSLIENGDTKEKIELYDKTKFNLVITLKATRMLNKNKLIKKEELSQFMHEYLHERRFGKANQLIYN